jgi:hypothetical protein
MAFCPFFLQKSGTTISRWNTRHHYLAVEYNDNNAKAQAAIFEVGKESIRTVLKTLEIRSGKKVQYEDKEAEKTGNN